MEGKHEQDAWRLRYKELDGLPLLQWPIEAKLYAMNDAEYTAKVFMRQVEQVGVDAVFASTLVDLRRQCMEAFALHLMSAWGFRTDTTAIDLLEHDLHQHVDGAVQDLLRKGLYQQKGKRVLKPPSRNMDVIRRLFAESFAARGELPGYTAGGTKPKADGSLAPALVKTDEETLRAAMHPDLEVLADIGADQKLLNTYAPVLRMGTQWPINPRYNVLVDTGRTSSSKPNIQNQPRRGGVRECFVPQLGYVYVACDYHTAELRSLAQSCLDRFHFSEMSEAFKQTPEYPHGKDLHLVLAANILGMPYEEAEKHKKSREVKDARQLAKAGNFGFPGGLGYNKFKEFAWKAYGLRLDDEASKKLKARWLQAYPEMRQHFAEAAGLTANGARFTHKQLRSGRMRGGVGYCDGLNSSFQGLTADGAKLACWAVVKESWTGWTWDERIPEDAKGYGPSPLRGFRPNGFIHDEIIGESPTDKFRQHAQRLSEVMVEAMRWFLPDVPVLADAHAMYRWFKDAEPVYDEKGQLVPWEPPNPKKLLLQRKSDHPLLAVADWTDEHCTQLQQEFADVDWRRAHRTFLLNAFTKDASLKQGVLNDKA